MITFLLTALADESLPRQGLPTQPISAKIQDLEFFAGHWQGTRGETWVEEWWSLAKDNVMMGSFRMHSKGKLTFTESMRLTEDAGTITMGIKHFSTDFSGWEEKNELTSFALTEIKVGRAVFHQKDEKGSRWIVYVRKGDEMTASLQSSAEAPADDMLFKFKLVE